MRFRTTLLAAGKTATGFRVPPEIVEALGAGKRPAVKVTINGFTYRSTIAPMGGDFMIGVNAENRAGAAVAAGDELDIELELDTEPREVSVPPELAAVLARNPVAKRNFEALSYSRKRQYTQPIAQAKTAATRERHIAKAIEELRG